MFLYQGLHFENVADMIGYALVGEIYITHSKEYIDGFMKDGQFECSNEHSLAVMRKVYKDFSEWFDNDEPCELDFF